MNFYGFCIDFIFNMQIDLLACIWWFECECYACISCLCVCFVFVIMTNEKCLSKTKAQKRNYRYPLDLLLNVSSRQMNAGKSHFFLLAHSKNTKAFINRMFSTKIHRWLTLFLRIKTTSHPICCHFYEPLLKRSIHSNLSTDRRRICTNCQVFSSKTGLFFLLYYRIVKEPFKMRTYYLS